MIGTVLLIAPFGSVLKDIPLALHEVLLFRTTRMVMPRRVMRGRRAGCRCGVLCRRCARTAFVGRTPDEYLLCFKARSPVAHSSVRAHSDRSSGRRIRRGMRQLVEEYVDGRRCDGRRSAERRSSKCGACEGRDGATRFRGWLEEEPDGAEEPQTETVLSITLDSAPNLEQPTADT